MRIAVAITGILASGIVLGMWLGTSDMGSDGCNQSECTGGTVTKIVDGDTVKVDGQSVRFALSFAPELADDGGPQARQFVEGLCPVGSPVTVDEDDGQAEGSHGRIIGVVYCNGANLNAELLDSGLGHIPPELCKRSEFGGEDWAQRHGCGT